MLLQHVNDRFMATFHNHVVQAMLKDGIFVLVDSYSNKEPILLFMLRD